ncbi:TonB-dependent receptor [Porticoccus sp. W117]|uniref:TonB-dependent receptor n=1 Tax=Porticoccus sp. W117 TaxID=3054777 RepID=UPI002595720F|nr:TonB-dependent receptor [Porticoccus sp. W117]MDM3870682.1 TonB-dependent receptor [Porticoccus sp. W117]
MKNTNSKAQQRHLQTTGLARGLCSALALSASLALAESQTVAFDIQQQSATSALNTFAEQANIQIMFSFDEAKDINANALKGTYSTEAALNQLLKNTGLKFQLTSSGSYVVREEEEVAEPETAPVDHKKKEVDEEVVITGTLLRDVNPASPMITLNSTDFERLGVNSAEDIIRSLPQNKASLNQSSSLTDTLLSSGREGGFSDLQGNAAANLRGIGVQNTLVLVNGRRTAGSPIFEGNFVNLSNIPFGAIERVEVLLDGASSIYGADAVGGVINFILKKGWTGSETSARYENSDNGGHSYSLTQNFGTSWGSGDLTASIGYTQNTRTRSQDAGWTTIDQTSIGGTDFRFAGNGSPGIISIPGLPPVSLPDSFDGTEDWTIADLANSNISLDSGVPEFLTPESKNKSLSLTINQDISDGISAFADLQYAINDTDSSRQFLTTNVTTMAGHPFNGLDRLQAVGYQLINETSSGLAPRAQNETSQTQKSLTTGLEFELPEGWRLRTEGSWSESSSESAITSFGAASDSLEDQLEFAEFVGGVRMMENPLLNQFPPACGSFQLFRARFVPVAADGSIACTAAEQQALPVDQVFNPFGNGSAQSERLRDFIRLTDNGSPVSTTQSFKAISDGELFDLAAGTVRAAVGLEYRQDKVDYTNNTQRTISSPFVADTAGDTNEPERTIKSVFTDLSIPLISHDQEIPGVHSLELQLSARWDEYTVDANRLNPTNNDPLLPDSATFSNTSPKAGIVWYPIESLKIRGTWSDVFRAPDYSELLRGNNVERNAQVLDQLITDPNSGELVETDAFESVYYESTADSFRREFDPTTFQLLTPLPNSVRPDSVIGGNANLEPETGDLITLGFDWTPSFLEGFAVSATYTKSELENQIDTIGNDFMPAASTLRNGDVYVRGNRPGFGIYRFVPDTANNPFGINGTFERISSAENSILSIQRTPVNTGGLTTETVDFNISYQFDTDWATWNTELYGTYAKTLVKKPLPVSPEIEEVGVINGVDQWVGTLRFGFTRQNYGGSLLVNYSSSYLNTRNNSFFNLLQGSGNQEFPKVEHYSTIDLTGHYSMENDGWRFLFGARNLLNQHFPRLTNVGRPFDSSRVDVRGRVIYLEAKKTFDI